MKTRLISLAVLFCLIAGPCLARVQVVATLPWIGGVVKDIGKDRIDVTVLVKPNQDPHQIEAKPSMILAARKADVLMYNGLDLEIGYVPVLIESSRNPKIQPGLPGNLDCSKFVTVVEKPVAVDRSLGDVHPLGNPHYHLSVKNMGAIAEGMGKRLAEVDPANAAFFQANAAAFRVRLEQKRGEWQKTPLAGKRFFAYHKFFEYLASDYGFSVIGYIEAKPGIPPSASHIQQLVEQARQAKPDGILTTAYYGRKETDALSDRTGVKVILVPHEIGSTPRAADWFGLMDEVFAALR
jgi:zinc/manganese transport system substrate-binding protein